MDRILFDNTLLNLKHRMEICWLTVEFEACMEFSWLDGTADGKRNVRPSVEADY